jgi:hypothetical protein
MLADIYEQKRLFCQNLELGRVNPDFVDAVTSQHRKHNWILKNNSKQFLIDQYYLPNVIDLQLFFTPKDLSILTYLILIFSPSKRLMQSSTDMSFLGYTNKNHVSAATERLTRFFNCPYESCSQRLGILQKINTKEGIGEHKILFDLDELWVTLEHFSAHDKSKAFWRDDLSVIKKLRNSAHYTSKRKEVDYFNWIFKGIVCLS